MLSNNTVNKMQFFRNKIMEWSDINYRDFPWRDRKDAYSILISEFMLQRTRAEQVVDVYNSFMKKFPAVSHLANADRNTVKAITRSLGLHWRSDNIISAAEYIMQNFNGDIPGNRNELLMIPGVGDYIAGMVLLTAYGIKDWAVDSNIARLFNRYFGLKCTGEIRRKKIIIDISREYFNTVNTRRAAYAILDFSALICHARKPACVECPVRSKCSFNDKTV